MEVFDSIQLPVWLSKFSALCGLLSQAWAGERGFYFRCYLTPVLKSYSAAVVGKLLVSLYFSTLVKKIPHLTDFSRQQEHIRKHSLRELPTAVGSFFSLNSLALGINRRCEGALEEAFPFLFVIFIV